MTEWTIAEVGEAIRARRVSPVEVTRAYLDRIARLDRRVRAFEETDVHGGQAWDGIGMVAQAIGHGGSSEGGKIRSGLEEYDQLKAAYLGG